MNFAYARYWHAHGTPFYAPVTRSVMSKINAHVPRVLHSISHLVCAVLALGSATHNTENSMCQTQKCTCRVCYCLAQMGGATMCITQNFHVIWHANIADSRISANSAEVREPLYPGPFMWGLLRLAPMYKRDGLISCFMYTLALHVQWQLKI